MAKINGNHQDDWGNIKDELDQLRDLIISEGINNANWNNIRKSFTDIWTQKRIEEMTLDEYTDTNRQYAFTYWVETVLILLGNIKGSNSIKFGIYKKAKGDGYEYKKFLHEGSKFLDHYINIPTLSSDISKDENRVFFVVKQNLLKIIEHTKNGNIEEIDKLGDLSPMFKWKIAFLYDINDKIIPIFSYNLLLNICKNNKINIDNDNYTEVYEKLLPLKNKNESIYEFHIRLYNEIKFQAAIYQISQSARGNAFLLRNTIILEENEFIQNSKNLFFWNDDKFKKMKMNIGDIVFFINLKKIESEEFSILITKIVDNSKNLILQKSPDGYVIDKYLIKKGDADILKKIGGKEDSLKDYIGKQFIVFDIIDETNNIIDETNNINDEEEDKKFNLGPNLFKKYESFDNIDYRLKIIIKTFLDNKSEYRNLENISFLEFYNKYEYNTRIKDEDLYTFLKKKNKELNIYENIDIFILLFKFSYLEDLKGSEVDIKENKDNLNKFKYELLKIYIKSFRYEGSNFLSDFGYKYGFYISNEKLLKENIEKIVKSNYSDYYSIYNEYLESRQLISREKFDIKNKGYFEEVVINETVPIISNFLKDIINFDYIYIYKNILLFEKVITNIFKEFDKYNINIQNNYTESDQGSSYNIGLLGKWGKGKTTIIKYGLLNLEKKSNKEEYEIYNIDIWKSYSNIGISGTDKLGVIKYFYNNLLIEKEEKIYNKIKKSYSDIFIFINKLIEKLKNKTIYKLNLHWTLDIIFVTLSWIIFLPFIILILVIFTILSSIYIFFLHSPFSSLTKLKDNLYNDIYIRNHYNITLWMILLGVILSFYYVASNNYYSIIITFLENRFNLSIYLANEKAIVSNILDPLFFISFWGVLFLIIYNFFRFIINFSFKTKIYKKQISDLNLAEDFKKEVTSFLGENKKKIIILENIDRLHPDQIIDFLGLTKTLLNINNTVYIIPIDQCLIIEGLKIKYKDSDFNPMEYIDKIINYPLFIINPYVNISNEKIIENGNKVSESSQYLGIKKNGLSKELAEYFTDDFIRKNIANYIPRKEKIFKNIINYYGSIYDIGNEFFKEENINTVLLREKKKLFLFFLSLRYANYNLFSYFEKNPIFLKDLIIKLFLTKDVDFDNIIQDIINIHKNLVSSFDDYKSITPSDLILLLSILKNFYTHENLKLVFQNLKPYEIREYMEKINI